MLGSFYVKFSGFIRWLTARGAEHQLWDLDKGRGVLEMGEVLKEWTKCVVSACPQSSEMLLVKFVDKICAEELSSSVIIPLKTHLECLFLPCTYALLVFLGEWRGAHYPVLRLSRIKAF